MAITVKHAFVNPIADEVGFPGTKPSDWNADHVVTGSSGGAPGGNQYAVQINDGAGGFTGDDAFQYGPDGVGVIVVGSTGNSGFLELMDGASGNFVVLGVPALSAGWNFTFPVDGGTNGYVLSTDGFGATSWIPAGGAASMTVGTSPIANGADRQLLFDDNGILGETNILFSASNYLSSPGTELVLEQTGDTFGTTRLHIQNRGGLNGALFENATLDLVDFGYKTSTGAMYNERFEHRTGNFVDPNNTTGEMQFAEIASSFGDRAFYAGLRGGGVGGLVITVPNGSKPYNPNAGGPGLVQCSLYVPLIYDGAYLTTSTNYSSLLITSDAAGHYSIRTAESGAYVGQVLCYSGFTKAGAAAASDILAGHFTVIHDSSGATTKLCYNDGGTLRTVALV